MSLVVVKKLQSSIIFVSDTLEYSLTAQLAEPILDPRIKITIINKDFALAFAGNIHFAELVTEEISLLKEFGSKELLDLLLDSNKNSKNGTDYILADSKEFKVYKVFDSRVEESSSAWIGSHDAFEIFQSNFENNLKSEDNKFSVSVSGALNSQEDGEIFSKSYRAMTSVISNDEIIDVGGFCLSMFSEDKKTFEYQFVRQKVSRVQTEEDISEEYKTVDFGDETEGAYDIEVFKCTGENRKTLALYFYTGRFGIVWHDAGFFKKSLKISNVYKPEFLKSIDEKFGLVGYCASSWQEYYNSGKVAQSKGDEEAAFYFYNKAIYETDEEKNISGVKEFYKTYFERGLIYYNRGEWELASKDFLSSIKYNESNFGTYCNLGNSLFRLGLLSDAIFNYDKALEIDPSAKAVLENKQVALEELGLHDETLLVKKN